MFRIEVTRSAHRSTTPGPTEVAVLAMAPERSNTGDPKILSPVTPGRNRTFQSPAYKTDALTVTLLGRGAEGWNRTKAIARVSDGCLTIRPLRHDDPART